MLDIIYDGACGFCRRSLQLFTRVDLWHRMRPHDGSRRENIDRRFPQLSAADLDDAMFAVTSEGRVYRGFFAVRRLLWESPVTWLLLPVLYLPGASLFGRRIYAWVARNRRELGCNPEICEPPLRHRDG
jgi:predicted DCC family thiol-disulfide oxidoreductase YuxK